jgi:hypothetical protein
MPLMMAVPHEKGAFLWCLMMSLAMHATLLVGALAITMSAVNSSRDPSRPPRERREQPLPDPAQMQLGLDAPNPPTQTWIGYEQYQRHAAPWSAVEQAAFRDDPVAAALRSADQRDIAPAFDAARSANAKHQLTQSQPGNRAVAHAGREHTAQSPATRPAENTAAPSGVSAASAAQPVARQPRATGEAGAQSDREADPSSTVDVPREHWQLGKPLAAHGLELKPRRPEVTTLTQLTAWPRNPTARITFDRAGVPTMAVLVVDTGDSRVDAAIVAALYRWRASGKPLQALEEGQTIDITIRLLINPERRRIEGEGA